MKHRVQVAGAQIPKPRRIARDPLFHAAGTHACGAIRPQPCAALTDPQRQAIPCPEIGVMAMRATDIPVPRQDRIVEKRLTQSGLLGIETQKVVLA